MADTLTTTPSSGSQATTQSPQTAGAANTGAANSSSVQPGTASDILRSSKGIQLTPTPVTTVNLGTATSGTTQAPASTKPHHINPVLGVFSIALFVFAIVLFWLTSRSAKNTT